MPVVLCTSVQGNLGAKWSLKTKQETSISKEIQEINKTRQSIKMRKNQMESLILAQDERWRRA